VDLDGDGIQDIVVAERSQAPSVVAYLRRSQGWQRAVIDTARLRVEAGATHYDIDGDGDQDIVLGGDGSSPEVWWWENPGPDLNPETPWQRHSIKRGGAHKHHDQLFGDFDGDGQAELVFWNQQAKALVLAEVPLDPRQAESWPQRAIYTYSDSVEPPQRGGYPGWKKPHEHEGLAASDLNGDGVLDIIGGGRWFSHQGEGQFAVHEIDPGYTFSRSLVGQFIAGGRPEVVLVAGDGVAPLILYTWQEEGTWTPQVLIDSIFDGHSVSAIDFNGDGHLDIFNAEMGLGNTPHPRVRLLLGNGQGQFTEQILLTDFGLHESVMADLDGDGDYDILGKPYTWEAPRLDIWLQD